MLYIIAGQFDMFHEILILGGDIRSRSWPNIGDSYGTMDATEGAYLLRWSWLNI